MDRESPMNSRPAFPVLEHESPGQCSGGPAADAAARRNVRRPAVVDGEARFPLLECIDSPADLRRLDEASLGELARELTGFLVETVARAGGHFSAGLGTVELTIALHYVFDTPRDALVWDVGHQCYPHKVLTGRRAQLETIRRQGGLSAFLHREESVHDAFGAGHSSTSISAALGIAVANGMHDDPARSVAIIGDGALTAGLAYEALQHAGASGADLLVVLNDNGMSISPNVGAMSDYLKALAAAAGRDGSVAPGTLFEDLGFEYLGPVDGHALPALLGALREGARRRGPRLLHVLTRKGHGYARAEADPVRFHGVTPFDPVQGIVPATSAPAQTYTQVFGDWLLETVPSDPSLVVVTPAMVEGSGLAKLAARHPARCHDVGIAEQHAVTFAAGLTCRGLRPIVAIYSTFLQRAYDQQVHDVALQGQPVTFAIDRAGVVGPDGATHNGGLDLSFLRCVPGLVVMTPSDGAELRLMLDASRRIEAPVAIRYPRATAKAGQAGAPPLREGRAWLRRRGRGTAILAFGTLVDEALQVAAAIDATVYDMRFVKPLDESTVIAAAASHTLVVTLEENALAGGAGSAINELLVSRGLTVPVLNLGLPDRYLAHGTREQVLADAGLDAPSIRRAIETRRARH